MAVPGVAPRSVTAAVGTLREEGFIRVQIGWLYGPGMALILLGVNVVLLVALVWWLDRGRIVSGIAEEPA